MRWDGKTLTCIINLLSFKTLSFFDMPLIYCIFKINLLLTSLSDGMTVFSPVSSARYRRSSVSINPSCPSQVSMFHNDDTFTVQFILMSACWFSPIFFISPLSLSPSLLFPWLETDWTRRDRWGQKEFRFKWVNFKVTVEFKGRRWCEPHLNLEVNNSCLCLTQEDNMEMTLRGSLQRLRYTAHMHIHTVQMFKPSLTNYPPPPSLSQCFQSDPSSSSQSMAWPRISGEHLNTTFFLRQNSYFDGFGGGSHH